MNVAKFTVSVALVSLLSGPALAEQVLRIGSAVPASSLQSQAWDLVAQKVAESGTGLKIELFPAGQLGTPETQVQNTALGIQDGFIESLGWWATYSADLKVESAPFLFDGREHLAKWLQSDGFEKVLGEVSAAGSQRIIIPDELWWRGPYRVLVGTKPILNFEDLAGTDLRMPAVEVMTRFWGRSGLGANIVNIAWGDTYMALLQGAADAVTSPFDLVVSMKFVEVAKHIMLFDEYQTIIVPAINENKWQQLTEEQRAAFMDALNEGGRYYNEELEKSAQGWRDEIEAAGGQFHEFDRQPFIERVSELNKTFEEQGYWRAGLMAEIEALR